MAGFAEVLPFKWVQDIHNIEDAGYTMAKSAVVSLTRSFAQHGPEGPWERDGIKAFALCPSFANTQLVASAFDIKSLEAKTMHRLLTVQEVGDSFIEALKLDVTGACYIVFPDCPMFNFHNLNVFLIAVLIAINGYICKPLGISAAVTYPDLFKGIFYVVCTLLILFILVSMIGF